MTITVLVGKKQSFILSGLYKKTAMLKTKTSTVSIAGTRPKRMFFFYKIKLPRNVAGI